MPSPVASATSAIPTEVSVVIPCFNQGQFLDEAIASARRASRGSIGIIVVDDGSTEVQTRQKLAALDDAKDVIVVRQGNQGLAAARNAGFTRTTTEFVQFLDCDDLLTEGAIDARLARLKADATLAVCIGDYVFLRDGSLEAPRPPDFRGETFSPTDFLMRWERGLSVPIHCALFRRGMLPGPPFDPRLRAKEDWVFWSLLATRDVRFAYLPGPVAIYRQHGANMCLAIDDMAMAWLRAAFVLTQQLPQPPPQFFDAALAHFETYYLPRIVENGVAIRLQQTVLDIQRHERLVAFASRHPGLRAAVNAVSRLMGLWNRP